MSRRSRSHNAYQSALSATITAGATSFTVDSASGLDEPCYLVIDPADPGLREFIKVGNVSGTTLSSVTRGLTGSASGAQAHDGGISIRAVPVAQWLNDIFDDIEDLETDTTNLAAADTAHFGGTDTADHPEATGSVRGFMSAASKTKLDLLDTTRQVTNGDSHNHNGGDGAQIDHATLANLTTGDPHTQYQQESTLASTVVNLLYPVGSIYISTLTTNPGTLLGVGTWAAFGAGRVLVGRDAGDVDFDTAEETGGAKTHTHTGPSHTHGGPSHTHAISGTTSSNGAHDHGGNTDEANAIIGSGQAYTTGANEHIHAITNQAAHNHTFSDTSSAGGTGNTDAGGTGATGSGSSLQPYIVAYMWKRTA